MPFQKSRTPIISSPEGGRASHRLVERGRFQYSAALHGSVPGNHRNRPADTAICRPPGLGVYCCPFPGVYTPGYHLPPCGLETGPSARDPGPVLRAARTGQSGRGVGQEFWSPGASKGTRSADAKGLGNRATVDVPSIRALRGAEQGQATAEPEFLGNGGTVEVPSSVCVPCPCHPALRAEISRAIKKLLIP